MIVSEKPASQISECPVEICESRWIWAADNPDESDVWIYARRQFNVMDAANSYLYITADLRYTVWINGQLLGFGPPRAHIETPTLDCYPIDDLLQTGRNVITVLVYSFGADGFIKAFMPRRGALIASLKVDGSFIPTDSSWLVRRELAYACTGVRLNENLPFMECFDARLSLGRPWDKDYDDSKWQPATELSAPIYNPWRSIELRDIPLLNWQSHTPDRMLEFGISEYKTHASEVPTRQLSKEIGEANHFPDNYSHIRIKRGLAGSSDSVTCDLTGLSDNQGCYVTYDFGRIWTGYPVISISGTAGSIIDLSYAEGLQKGRVNPAKQGLFYTDRIILDNDYLEYRIHLPRALRYLQIDVRRGKATIDSVKLDVSTYPVIRQGQYHCSDPVLDQAWEISAHTVQLCMEDNYMDTPWRERGIWLGDILPEAHANYYAFGDKHLIRRFLLQHAKGQKQDGSMCGKYPGRYSSHISTWNLTYALALIDYVQHTGDSDLAVHLWPTVKGTADWLDLYLRDDGLYGDFPLEVTAEICIYNFIDWAPVDTSGANAAFNAIAYSFWKACAHIAELSGFSKTADGYMLKAQNLRHNIQELFWDGNRGTFVNGIHNGKQLDRFGVHENMLSVLFGIAREDQQQSILSKFDRSALMSVFEPNPADYEGILSVAIALNRYPWPSEVPVSVGTPYFSYWLLQSICELGEIDIALDFIRRHWGEFSRRGGTTVWENWTGGYSLSHGFSAAPVIVLSKYVLGAKPTASPDIWNVFPMRSNLEWAEGRVPTTSGILGVSWKWNGSWDMEICVPGGLTVNVGIPAVDADTLVVDGVENPSATTAISCNTEYKTVKIGEGRHTIQGSR